MSNPSYITQKDIINLVEFVLKEIEGLISRSRGHRSISNLSGLRAEIALIEKHIKRANDLLDYGDTLSSETK